MRKLLNKVQRFRKDEDGAALVEYVIILGLILAVSLVVLTSIGNNANLIFTAVNNALAAAAAAA
jgi:pilus assembly protein Flp/PilA